MKMTCRFWGWGPAMFLALFASAAWPADVGRLSLSQVFQLEASSEEDLSVDSARCAPADICFRFLWSADQGGPGQKMSELSGRLLSDAVPPPPLPAKAAKKIRWSLPSGVVAAETVIYLLDTESEFTAYALVTVILVEVSGPMGDFNRPAFALPALTPPAGLNRLLTFKMDAFSPPTTSAVPTNGPVILYNDHLETVVFSPLEHFLTALQVPSGGEWLCGVEGEVEKIPAGAVHATLVVSGRGLNRTLMKWGDLIRGWVGHERPSAYADVGLTYLGYWTDNGGYYYYKTAPGKNYHETLLAVRADALARDIPYGYFQIDSWWYPKAKSNNLLQAARGGSLRWEPIPELFPHGLPAFQQELGLPLIAHNRWYNRDSPYCARYQCVYGTGSRRPALPVDPAFWDEIMDNAVKYGVKVYEQDWLATQFDMIPWLRSGLTNAEQWFDTMIQAAARRGLTVQLCMASPGFFLQQMKHPNVTQVRTSNDYIAGVPKTFYWPDFHTTSLFAYAVGLWPFKDNFQSRSGQRLLRNEKWPFEEALISILSAGLVGPSDKIGTADRELLLRTCRKDGVLLKPDLPATPIDLMFLDHRKPWIVTTHVDHHLGRTVYLLALNLWPEKMRDPAISFAELGLSGKYAVYNFRTREILLDADRIDFGKMPRNQAFFYELCPILDNGMAVIGEADKFISLSRKRFALARYQEGALIFDIMGVPGEIVPFSVYSPFVPKHISGCERLHPSKLAPQEGVITVQVEIPEDGHALVMIE